MNNEPLARNKQQTTNNKEDDNMSEEKEQKLRLQFLGEAQEYLNAIELGLLRISSTKIENQRIDEILRSAHSIKGSAAMMGFGQLSHFAHRLEDFFKVIRVKKNEVVDEEVESFLLMGVDRLAQIVKQHLQEIELDRTWLSQEIIPIFEQLHQRLGDPVPEDASAILAADLEADMSVLIFETEVEECLHNLEEILAIGEPKRLKEELSNIAQMLSGLGEMLELPAFTSLCQSTLEYLNEAATESIEPIAVAAIQAWRRSQALVVVGQIELLPTQLELSKDRNAVSTEQNSNNNTEQIDETSTSLESVAAFLDTDRTEAIEAFASLADIMDANPETILAPELEQTELAASELTQASDFDRFSTTKDIEVKSVEDDTDKTIRVAVGQLEYLSELFGEVAIERNALKSQLKNLRYLVGLLNQRIKKLEQSNFSLRVAYDRLTTAEALTSNTNATFISGLDSRADAHFLASSEDGMSSFAHSNNSFDALEMDSYNDIHLLSGDVMEGVVQIQEVSRDLDLNLEETERNARQLNRTTRQMQNTITQVRMRPLEDLVGRFPRALRDMELQYGKKVGLQVKGGATPIERSTIEALNDPLLHLFRNAFDHGIESPEVRQARGKPEQGMIAITATHRGDRTIITVSDDGGGINLNKIRARALEMGLDAEEVTNASDSELLELIFEPGFSTAAEITDLSGRGVGMDVVRTNVEKVKGKVEVSTEFGIGTTFTITVPFSVSVMRVLLVESDGMLFAIPTNAVEEVLTISPETILATDTGESIALDDKSASLIRLARWLQLPDRADRYTCDEIPAIDEPTVLIIAKADRLYAIQVERYWREEEATIRQIEGFIQMPPGLTGCTILGDGRVVPLVDTFALIDWIENTKAENLADGSEERRLAGLIQGISRQQFLGSESKAIAPRKTILVVDDSVNVRRFLALMLEKANYRVEQAKDGLEALEKLQAGIIVQAAICDLEMPRLDGYGFLSRLKSQEQYKAIPAIVLTSRNSDKHRRLAMNLGAAAYLNKPFQEPELLNMLEELLT
jgi:chemosensory pili system protein ChpA (sensor histidine kinase/response regulator)